MIDQTLNELWEVKDNIAKENKYDVDNLVSYLRLKEKDRKESKIKNPKIGKTERDNPPDPQTRM